ncbi:PadR family transcriptional regulator [Streptomyces sp. AC495_CC817]|uniref:PadR family transcriptional regulator n=1 Tax=Streptomyces sp. AC495_CC817 TaxID=2823900 RepID=UPI001C273D84|nr:PadR family transcriptional regulator [Streptomyces sp. AC495_CC817]
MELTPTELTVLGLVIEHPRHGYDLEQVIEQRGIRRWTDIGFSSIYYVLSKLEKRGLVEADGAVAGAKARRVVRATPEGRRVAREAVSALIVDPRPAPQPFLVGVANLALLAPGSYADALSARLSALEARIAGVREALRAQQPLPPAADEVFSYSLALLEAERAWLAERVGATDD